MNYSNCCSEPILENTDICSCCGEHCEPLEEAEYTKEDEAYDKASSNKGELI